MKAQQRLWLTADKKALVREGDPKAATLYAAEGDTIPDSAAALFGLKDGRLNGRPSNGDAATGLPAGAAAEGAARGPEKAAASTATDAGGAGSPDGAERNPGAAAAKVPNDAGQQPGSIRATDGPADDLTRIKGIGPATAAKLRAIGVTTFADLARLKPPLDAALDGLGSDKDWRSWIMQAKQLAGAAAPEQKEAPAPATKEAPAPQNKAGLTILKPKRGS